MKNNLKLSDLLPYSGNTNIVFKKEELPDGQKVTVVFYQYLKTSEWEQGLIDPNFFEIRGAVFDEMGQCICRPFEKFFNVGQVPWTSWEGLDESTELYCQDKKDGSLINPVLLKTGAILWKTKKSHFSETSQWANKDVPARISEFAKYAISQGLTPNLEYMAPRWKIVLDYGPEPKFELLAIRQIATGDYLSPQECLFLANKFDLTYSSPVKMTKKELIGYAETAQNVEGVVLTLGPYRAKLKTHWYMRKHYSDTDLRFRDVADAVIEETFDDLLAMIVSQGEVALSAEVSRIEKKVLAELAQISEALEKEVALLKEEKDFKLVAHKLKDNPLQKLIFRRLRGTPLDSLNDEIKKHWKFNFREAYPLIAIVNNNFR